MKNKKLWIVLASLLCSGCMFFAGCGEDDKASSSGNDTTTDGGTGGDSTDGDSGNAGDTATALATPFVIVDQSTGVASWGAIENAVGYIYKLDDGAEQTTVNCSVQLSDGQSIVVKAVSNVSAYTDSGFSLAQTYTASTGGGTGSGEDNTGTGGGTGSGGDNTGTGGGTGSGGDNTGTGSGSGSGSDSGTSGGGTSGGTTTNPTGAPTYLGIEVSTSEPSATTPDFSLISLEPLNSDYYYQTWLTDDTITTYFEDSNNSLGDTLPQETDYDLYTSRNSKVYIKLWFNNPEQHTILSLKINGVKQQGSGTLKSYFYQDGDSYLNCVYIEMTTPTNVNTIDYVVSEIEYIEGANIGQDGTQLFIGENDTVSVGLWYDHAPSVSIEQTDLSCYSATYSIDITDDQNIIADTGAWARVVLYHDNVIYAQQKLVVGHNEITFDNLDPETFHEVAVVGYLDALYGNGLRGQNITNGVYDFVTKPIVEFNDGTQGDYTLVEGVSKAEIVVDVTKYDSTKSYEKIEIYLDNDTPTYDYGDSDGDGTTEEGTTSGGTTEGETIITPDGEVIVDGNVTADGSTSTGGGSSGVTVIPKTPDFTFDKTKLEEMGFNGYYAFTDGILNGQTYVVRVYYTETEYARIELQTPVYKTPTIEVDYSTNYLQFYDDAMFGYIFTFDGSNPDAYVKDYTVHFRMTDNETGETIYDLTADRDTYFFNSNYIYYSVNRDSYYEGDKNSYTNEGKLYFARLEDYLKNQMYDRMDDVTVRMWIVADLNDGLGEREIEVGLSFYHASPKGGLGDYEVYFDYVDSDGDGTNDTLQAGEEEGSYYYPNNGYLYKVVLENTTDDTTYAIYTATTEYTVDEEAWIAWYLETICAEMDGSLYQNLYGVGSAKEYFATLSGAAEALSWKISDIDKTGMTVGRYNAKLYYRYANMTYAEDEAEQYWGTCYEVLTVYGPQLATPTAAWSSDNRRSVEWNAVANANYYNVYKNGEFYNYIYQTSYNFYDAIAEGDTVQVQAIYADDDPLYPTSALSAAITFTIPQLATPTVTQESTYVYTWERIENCSSYRIYVNGNEFETTGDTTLYIEDYRTQWYNEYGSSVTIRIQAVGDSYNYKDSELSNSVSVTVGYSSSADK